MCVKLVLVNDDLLSYIPEETADESSKHLFKGTVHSNILIQSVFKQPHITENLPFFGKNNFWNNIMKVNVD